MPRISEEEIAAVRSRADIVDVIDHYVQVVHKGNSYKALCPFHDDHSPSLSINPSKGIYKCFVCGNGGNVFTFVQNFEKITFIESVYKVASLCGYEMSHELVPVQKKPIDSRKERLCALMGEMVRYTVYQLELPQAVEKKRYLENRGLDEKIRKHFDIGFNPPGDAVYRFLGAKGYEDREMVDANVARVSGASYRDVFADRITFPIHDGNGNVVGFSARTIDPDVPAKYINTTETDVFKKGELVYNAHRARSEARRKGKIYVCEGVTDVIAFFRAGIENCVCTLGTACTTQQVQLLRSLAPNVVLCYDGDEPGQAATLRAGRMVIDAGLGVRVVRNRTGQDPDEIIRASGADALREMIGRELAWMEFVIDYHSSRADLGTYLGKKEFIDNVLPELNKVNDPEEQRYFSEQLRQLTNMSVNVRFAPPSVAQEPVQELGAKNGCDVAERTILALMMKSADAIEDYKKDLGFLNNGQYQSLALMILDKAREKGEIDPVMLLDMTDNQSIRDLITSLINPSSYDRLSYSHGLFQGLTRRVLYETARREADVIRNQVNSELNDASRKVLLEKYQDCLSRMRRLIDDEQGISA